MHLARRPWRATTRRSLLGLAVLAGLLAATPGASSQGQQLAGASAGGGNLKRVTKSFQISGANSTPRMEVICPRNSYALGGGMSSRPGISADGSGVYPHSYERLGVQRGWHITRSSSSHRTQHYARASQSNHAGRLGPEALTPTAPCADLFPQGGDSPRRGTGGLTIVGPPAYGGPTCPKGQVLLSGGFQRTSFTDLGGSYVTESRPSARGPGASRVAPTASSGASWWRSPTASAARVVAERGLAFDLGRRRHVRNCQDPQLPEGPGADLWGLQLERLA